MIARLLCRLGFLSDTTGSCGFYDLMRWRRDFWNGSLSWIALRYRRRHGFAAWRARYYA